MPESRPDRPFAVLVLCTGNSARSILAEALFNHLGRGRVEAYSAGSRPTGMVNPLALETLAAHGIAFPAARSKSWDEFAVSSSATARRPCPRSGSPGLQSRAFLARPPHSAGASSAPTFDFIITVCDSAAAESCPIWPGHPATVHWGTSDPAHVEPPLARRAAFETAYAQLEKCIHAFLALPLETMTAEKSAVAVRRIHEKISRTGKSRA
jgi:arsenate reductase